MPIVNRVADLHGEITAWRRDIHAHPELLYEVHRTAASVADKLKTFGCDEVVTGIGQPGWSASSVAARPAPRWSGCARIWMRCRSRRRPVCPINRRYRARCTPAATTAIPPCCSGPLNTSRTRAILPAPRVWISSRRGGAPARAPCCGTAFSTVSASRGLRHGTTIPRMPVGEFAIRPGPMMASTAHDRDQSRRKRRARRLAACHGRYGFGRGADRQSAAVDRGAQCRSAAGRGDLDLHFSGRPHRQRHPPARSAARDGAQPVSQNPRSPAEAGAGVGGRHRPALRRQGGADLYARLSGPGERGGPYCPGRCGRRRGRGQRQGHPRLPAQYGRKILPLCCRSGRAPIYLGNGDSAGLHHPAYDFNDEAIPVGTSYWIRLAETALGG